jgi:hypothetical protein
LITRRRIVGIAKKAASGENSKGKRFFLHLNYRDPRVQKNKTEHQRHMVLLEREKVSQEVQILRDFLPICASFKEIRDDTGYWSQIEGSIKNHSEAKFAHSICPNCAKRLYPDIYEKK